MSAAVKRHENNIVMDSGELFLDILDSDGNLQGERYIGDSVALDLSIVTERTTVWSGDGPIAVKLADSVRTVERTLGFTAHDISAENLALFLLAALPAQDTDDGGVRRAAGTAYKIEGVRLGRWYQLGATSDAPWGVHSVIDAAGATGVKVWDHATARVGGTNDIAAASYVLDADYGRIYIQPAAADISAGDDIWVEYTPKGASGPIVRTSASTQEVLAAIRYISDPAVGRGRNVYARRCSIAPGGEAALKSRETEMQLRFSAIVLEPGGDVPALVVDGREA